MQETSFFSEFFFNLLFKNKYVQKLPKLHLGSKLMSVTSIPSV